jgi:hypothetical protein
MNYYIHLEDPGFPDHPWPGVRRLGPFLTLEEATEQAISDAALGHGVALGVYSEEESEKRYSGGKEGKAAFARAGIRSAGEALAKKNQKAAIEVFEENKRAVEAMLPAGVGWEELMELARAQRDRIVPLQSFPPTESVPPPAPVSEGEE